MNFVNIVLWTLLTLTIQLIHSVCKLIAFHSSALLSGLASAIQSWLWLHWLFYNG
jgi:hypothetical protein